MAAAEISETLKAGMLLAKASRLERKSSRAEKVQNFSNGQAEAQKLHGDCAAKGTREKLEGKYGRIQGCRCRKTAVSPGTVGNPRGFEVRMTSAEASRLTRTAREPKSSENSTVQFGVAQASPLA
jgi:hypothetical protein